MSDQERELPAEAGGEDEDDDAADAGARRGPYRRARRGAGRTVADSGRVRFEAKFGRGDPVGNSGP